MPTHFFGEPGYISDTENTVIVNTQLFEAEKRYVENDIININQENYDHHIEL
jgi:hypothetical protein